MIKRLIWTPMSSVLKKADKLNPSLSLHVPSQSCEMLEIANVFMLKTGYWGLRYSPLYNGWGQSCWHAIVFKQCRYYDFNGSVLMSRLRVFWSRHISLSFQKVMILSGILWCVNDLNIFHHHYFSHDFVRDSLMCQVCNLSPVLSDLDIVYYDFQSWFLSEIICSVCNSVQKVVGPHALNLKS